MAFYRKAYQLCSTHIKKDGKFVKNKKSQELTICYVQENHFKYENKCKLKVKELKKILEKHNQKFKKNYSSGVSIRKSGPE